jgi:anaphase-promoting complex subunit 1
MTLAQIGRKPISDKCVDRDCYSLAAGYALGLINIGKGSKNPNIKDLMLEERLIRFIEGGKIMEPPQSILSSNFNQENKCSSIREGNTVNTHITAPAALLALSLIFLKSNNFEIQSRVSIPHSFSTIESANPNHILLKIVTKNLIMWDSITNTTEFIYNQIPELIRFIYEKNLKDVYERYYFVYNVDEIDFNTVTLVYVNIIGGCIMAMGLKYAGTGNLKCVETIMREIEKFRAMKVAKTDLANDPANKNAIDQYNLFGLLSVCMISLGLIMAGSCDIQCLKIGRIIRKKFQDAGNMHYGFNLALNMAIGFLFLGFGR